MAKPPPISDSELAELRRLYRAASRGRREAHVVAGGHVHLYCIAPDGGAWLLAMPSGPAKAQLMAVARNALPRRF